jgi:hypothetical protein
MNVYGFAGGDPVNFSDPFGLWPCPELCGAGAGGGAVAVGVRLAAPALPSVAPAAGVIGLAVVGGILIQPAFPGSGKTALGRGVGTFANEATQVEVPTVDGTGKVHGALPGHVPESWTEEDLEHAEGQLGSSIKTRKDEQKRLGEDGPHRERIRQEERLKKQIEKKRSGS